jgi:signal transduction histidine kinase
VLAVGSNWLDRLEKLVSLVWLSQLAQDFKEESAIDQIKIQLLKLALCLLQFMGSALLLKKRKRRSQQRMIGKKKKTMNMILILTKLSKKYTTKIRSLFERLQEQELLLEQQEEYLIDKIEELKTLNKEHVKLKHFHISLIDKHENLEKEYACATNVSSCVDPLEK